MHSGRLLLTISLGNIAPLSSMSVYVMLLQDHEGVRSAEISGYFLWVTSPQDNKIHSHDYKLTPYVCNDNASLLHTELLVWVAQNDESEKKTNLSPNDQILVKHMSSDDIRRTLFTIGPFAVLDNILDSPHNISLRQMVICAYFKTTTLIPRLKNSTVPYLLTTTL